MPPLNRAPTMPIRSPRPSWSPNGRYLAFVRTRSGSRYGYLTRYDIATRKLVTFSVPYNSEAPTVRQIKVRALPGTAVAWGWAICPATCGLSVRASASTLLWEAACSCRSSCHSY